MPWHVAKTDKCPASKPFGVIKDSDGSVDGRCHETRSDANKQLAALYANEPEALYDPAAQIRWAMEYIKERYGGE